MWAKFPSQLAGGSGTSQAGPSYGRLQCFLPGQAMTIRSTGGWSLNGSKHKAAFSIYYIFPMNPVLGVFLHPCTIVLADV